MQGSITSLNLNGERLIIVRRDNRVRAVKESALTYRGLRRVNKVLRNIAEEYGNCEYSQYVIEVAEEAAPAVDDNAPHGKNWSQVQYAYHELLLTYGQVRHQYPEQHDVVFNERLGHWQIPDPEQEHRWYTVGDTVEAALENIYKSRESLLATTKSKGLTRYGRR